MSDILTRGTNIPTTVVDAMFNSVAGHSALAKLSQARPIAFNGETIFVFGMDKEVDVVAENGAKTNGGGTATPVSIVPVKFEYGMRVSDEFLKGSEEYNIRVTEDFVEGFGRKLARGIDLAAFHGVNPRTGNASAVIGDNCFDEKVDAITTTETASSAILDALVNEVIGNGYEVNGIALAPAFAAGIGAETTEGGAPLYPEFKFGRVPESFYGMNVDVNSTVLASSAYVGDFANAFRWGYNGEIPFEVIEYGNPDNDATLGDLKGHNQVYLRCEAYVGWGILNPAAFAYYKA